MEIIPIDDRIAVVPEKPEDRTKSGLIIPNAAKIKPQIGTVIAAGEGREGLPMKLKVGDKILYSHNVGAPFKFREGEFIIMRQSDVLAKLG